MLRTSFCAALLAAAVLPATAGAEVIVKGTGEPEFTNSANNTQWVQWSNSGPYRVEFQHRVNGGAAVVDGPYNVAQTGSSYVNWTGISGVSVPLQEGSTYTVCAYGRWQDAYGMWYGDFSTSCGDADRRGLRASTTIDRTKPAITISAPTVTRTTDVQYVVGYQDNLAYPFGTLFLAVDDAPQFQPQPAGCAPAQPRSRVTSFTCTTAIPATDGPHRICAIVPDAAIPDNPYSDDQRATAASANLSDPKCADVLLDRAAPEATVAGPDELVVGTAGRFVAQVADGGSGVVAASATWAWADGERTVDALEANHAFSAVGTYNVRFTVRDAAGNEREVVKAVRVVAAPQPGTGGGGTGTGGTGSGGTGGDTGGQTGGGTGTGGTGTGTGGTGGTGGTATGGTGTGTGTGTGGAGTGSTGSGGGTTTGGGTVTGSGGGTPTPGTGVPAAKLTIRSLGVRRTGGRQVLRLAVTGAATTTVRVTVRRGKRTIATKRLAVKAGRVALPLPRRALRGTHVVTLTAGRVTARTTVRIAGAKASASIAATRSDLDARGLERRLP